MMLEDNHYIKDVCLTEIYNFVVHNFSFEFISIEVLIF